MPNLQELDLSRNLLSNWACIQALARELGDTLQSLTISYNVFRLLEPVPAQPAFTTLRTLVLNWTRLSWEQVRAAVSGTACRPVSWLTAVQIIACRSWPWHHVCPMLEELHACSCALACLSRPDTEAFPQLKVRKNLTPLSGQACCKGVRYLHS